MGDVKSDGVRGCALSTIDGQQDEEGIVRRSTRVGLLPKAADLLILKGIYVAATVFRRRHNVRFT